MLLRQQVKQVAKHSSFRFVVLVLNDFPSGKANEYLIKLFTLTSATITQLVRTSRLIENTESESSSGLQSKYSVCVNKEPLKFIVAFVLAFVVINT